jgi:hypothetical protein
MNAAPLLLLALLILALCRPWGPGSHLEFAQRAYRNRRRHLSPAISRLLHDQRPAFLYGNIAADIINFKGYGGHYNHCHRWTIVRTMRQQASSATDDAFILGYLSHLAADTIAHNHFVPYHLARYARAKGLGHLYWEMRADGIVTETTWRTVARLKSDRSLDQLHELVSRAVPRRFLSMRANTLLFNHVLLLSARDSWRRGVNKFQGRSAAPLEKKFLDLFRRASVARIRLALRPEGLEALAHIDTNGKEAQASAWKMRKRILRRFASSRRRRLESEEAATRFLEGMETPPPVGSDPPSPHW